MGCAPPYQAVWHPVATEQFPVMPAINMCQFDNYWSQTSSFEAIRNYINMDFDGVKQTIENLLIGNFWQGK